MTTRHRPRTGRRVLALATVLAAGGAVVASTSAAQADAPATVITVPVGHERAPIDPMLLGGNGRWAYDNFGAWNPSTQHAYPAYTRALRRSGITSVRYPGGTIANLYHWQRAIGPVAQRVDQVHGSPSTFEPLDNDFGPDEYGAMTEQLGQRGIVVVNFATGTPQEAADWVEYMTGRVGENRNGGVDWAGVRARNGHRAPYDIRYWEVGNEMSLANQLYWRGGASDLDPTTLYARGGATTFTRQTVAQPTDYRDSAAVSNGGAGQSFVAKYAPVVVDSAHVYVGDDEWQRTDDLSTSAADAHVFTLDATSGRIHFGDGQHGAVPPKGDTITISYTSGPHAGFDAFYAAMKKANPDAQVCAGLSGVSANEKFAALMGSTHRYDCVEQHAYVNGPAQTDIDPEEYYGRLMLQTATQTGDIEQIQDAIDEHAGRRARHVDVVVSEYGQLGNPHPDADPDFHASLSQALFMADDLAAFVRLGIPVADKSNLTDFVNEPAPGGSTSVGAPLNAMIAGPGPDFQLAPTGLLPKVFAPLTGSPAVLPSVQGNPSRTLQNGAQLPALTTIAARRDDGKVELLVINQDPRDDVRAEVRPGADHRAHAHVQTLDGPDVLSRNTPDAQPVRISTSRITVGTRDFVATFPAHSVTRIELTPPA